MTMPTDEELTRQDEDDVPADMIWLPLDDRQADELIRKLKSPTHGVFRIHLPAAPDDGFPRPLTIMLRRRPKDGSNRPIALINQEEHSAGAAP